MTDPSRAQTVDTEIAKHCAYSLPGVALTLGRQNWHCLKDTYETLASDMQVSSRSSDNEWFEILWWFLLFTGHWVALRFTLLPILLVSIMNESVTVVSEEAGCVWCSVSKEKGQFEWEMDLQWEREERSPISSACLRSYGSAWDSHRHENLGCAAVREQTCAPAGMSGAQWVSLTPGLLVAFQCCLKLVIRE